MSRGVIIANHIFRYIIIFLVINGFSCFCYAQKDDLNFIYEQIIENHPGIYNKLDPEFKLNLNKEYSKANKLLDESSDLIKHQSIITSFAKSFDDSHLRVKWYNEQQPIAKDRPLREFIINDINLKTLWIGLPTFDLNKKQKNKFKLVLEKVPHISDKDIIIFDLRGNGGGNSDYGTQLTNKLFGESCVRQRKDYLNADMYVDWRASKGNIKHIESLYKNYPLESIRQAVLGMQQSYFDNKSYYKEFFGANSGEIQASCMDNKQAKIIVIIDRRNVSSALSFIDELKMMSSSIYLIGEDTNSDRLYMEVRTEILPSGKGEFSFPIKVYRNRIREDNVPYKADIKYESNLITLKNIMCILKRYKIY